MVSAVDSFKRALVAVLRALAVSYGLTFKVTRDSSNAQVRTAFRKASQKAHPDKGGSEEDQKRLNDAYTKWQGALQAAKGTHGGRPGRSGVANSGKRSVDQDLVTVPAPRLRKKEFRIQSRGVLLTYQKFHDVGVWARFLVFVKTLLVQHGVRYWGATLETNTDGTYHLHLMLQFCAEKEATVASFAFEGAIPNAAANDLLGEGWGGRHYQQSLDRGFFYVWADKEGKAASANPDLATHRLSRPRHRRTSRQTHRQGRGQVGSRQPRRPPGQGRSNAAAGQRTLRLTSQGSKLSKH